MAEGADIALVGTEPINLSYYTNLSYVVCNMTNTDHIKMPKDAKLISLDSGELYDVTSTAEHTIWLMLSLLRCKDREEAPGRSISKMTVGIIGNGRVGKLVCTRLHSFGCRVLTFDVNGDCTSSLEELLKHSDIITLHTSVRKKDKKYVFGVPEFKQMRDGACLINTSRPYAINPNALLKYARKLNGFASDFPMGVLPIKNTITHHTGGYSIDDMIKTSEFCFNALKKDVEAMNAKNAKRKAANRAIREAKRNEERTAADRISGML